MEFYSPKFAIQYLAKRLKTKEEAEALNFLIKEINSHGRKDEENKLFAKLYLHLYEGNIQVFKDTTGTRKVIADILRKPLTQHIQEVKEAYTHVALAESNSDEKIVEALKMNIDKHLRDMLNEFIEVELNDPKNHD